jgi:hypothetical protein
VLAAASTAVYNAGAAAVAISPGLTLSDQGSDTIAAASVSVTAGGFAGDGDLLSADVSGTSILASYDPAAEVLTLSGSDSAANYQRVLDSVAFRSALGDPTAGNQHPFRTIAWQVTDADSLGGGATTTLLLGQGGSPGHGQPVADDFFGDRLSDILFDDAPSGTVAIWTVANNRVQSSIGVGAASSNWQIVATGDFDGDGKTDILFRYTPAGATDQPLAIWEMNGGQVKASLGAGSAGSDWHVVGAGDFDGDGKSDILWRNDNGTVAIWEMNGNQVKASLGAGSAGSDWTIVGAGDFNGDGRADILWRNTTLGTVAVWQMNGNQVEQSIGLGTAGLSWTIAGIGDFDGDGRADILWRDSASGTVAIWEIANGQVKASLGVGSAGSSWQIAGVGDYDADGKSDILWRDSASGTVAVWELNGASVKASIGLGAAANEWTIPHPTA